MGSVDFDVLVVGSGPAGATAALTATRRGLRVGLIDRQTFPRDKPCGDGLGPGVVRLLRDLDLGGALAEEKPMDWLTVYGPDGVELNSALVGTARLPAEGFVVPRRDFDHRLWQAAQQAGAVSLTGHKVVGTGLDQDRRWVDLRTGSGPRRFHARLVVGADGAYSTLRRLLGGVRPGPRRTGIAMRAYADMTGAAGAAQTRMLFEWSRELQPAYGWVFPTGRGVANVGVGVMLSTLRRRGLDLRQTLERFAASCRRRGIPIGELSAHRAHHLPLASRVPRLAYPRAVLIGDAASMINPLSGEGISYGIASAQDLAVRLPDALHDEAALTAALDAFEHWFRRTHRLHFASCVVAYRLMASPWWAKRMIRAAHRDPAVFQDALQLLFGMGRIHSRTIRRILQNGW